MNSHFGRDAPHHIRLLVDQVPAMLAYWDRDLRCRFANRAYERWFGVDPDSLVGTTLNELLGPALFALNEPYVRAALAGQQQVFERIVPGPGGARRHSLATYVPDIVDGQVQGFVAHVAEVTQLKETEAALRAEAAQREIALNQLRESRAALVEAQRLGGVGNWDWEIASDITIWSDELYRIFGRDPTQLPPGFAEHGHLYRPDSWQQLQQAVARAVGHGEPYTLELQYHRPDGHVGWLEARGEAVRDETGDIVRLRGTVHEVTQRHQMEAARIEARAAEEASRSQSQLLSRVSHELRTPLNAILGFSQLLEREPALSPKHQRWAATIVESGRHMIELVDDVLELAAADAGRSQLHIAAVDPLPVLTDCVQRAAAAARAAGIGLHGPSPAPGGARLRGDATRLRQVVDKLLSNAIKFTPAGGRVDVALTPREHDVEIIVSDTGIGMSPEQTARLFRPFEPLGTDTPATAGLGLGLALARLFVNRMGGSLQVHTAPGLGSRFVVTLPTA